MNKMLLGIIVMVLLVQPVVAIQPDITCNTTTGVYQELIRNGTTIKLNNTFSCPNGCADNGLECDYPAPPEMFFAFAIVFGIAALALAYIGIKLPEDFNPLRVMFMVFSLMYIAFDAYVMSGFSLLTMNTLNSVIVGGYVMGVFTVLGTVFFFVYLLVRKLLEQVKNAKISGRPIKW